MYTVSLTSQGQISIPVQLRKLFNFDVTKKVTISETDGGLLIKPVVDFLELGGSLKTNKKPLSNEKLHEIFSESVL